MKAVRMTDRLTMPSSVAALAGEAFGGAAYAGLTQASCKDAVADVFVTVQRRDNREQYVPALTTAFSSDRFGEQNLATGKERGGLPPSRAPIRARSAVTRRPTLI